MCHSEGIFIEHEIDESWLKVLVKIMYLEWVLGSFPMPSCKCSNIALTVETSGKGGHKGGSWWTDLDYIVFVLKWTSFFVCQNTGFYI